MHIARPANALYAYMPGIMGSNDGYMHVSAGTFAFGDMNTDIIPMRNAAINEAMLIPVWQYTVRTYLRECPVAAITAQNG